MLWVLVVASGVLVVLGISANALHVTIAAMLVAPGFMPIMRITLGIVSRSRAVLQRGLIDVVLVYGVLIVTAGLMTLGLRAAGTDPLPGKAEYYAVTKSFFTYWTTVTASSILSSAAAALAGAILIATKRSVFTSGVMIGLALVPSAALVGMCLATGDIASAGKAAVRFLVDVALVLGVSAIFFSLLRVTRHQRDIAL